MSRFLLHSCVIPNLSAALIRKECFAAAGLLRDDYRVVCDWDLFFRISDHYDVAYVAEPLNRFRQHATTIRSATKERIVYSEYFRLRLGQIRRLNLSLPERARFRASVMFAWAGILISGSSAAGLKSFPHHLGFVLRHDPWSLAYLAPALVFRVAKIVQIAVFR